MQLSFVLVEPARASNVGAAARALKTMGFAKLVLVNSHAHQNKEARWVAHGAHDILENCETVVSLNDIRPHYDLMVATTARERSSSRHYLSPQQLNEQLLQKTGKCALVFGCEASGLTNEQLALCDLYSYIPLAQPYPSLNLAQAVMIYSYALSDLAHTLGLRPEAPQPQSLQVLKQRVADFMTHCDNNKSAKLQEWLQERLSGLSDRDVRMAHQLMGVLENKKRDN